MLAYAVIIERQLLTPFPFTSLPIQFYSVLFSRKVEKGIQGIGEGIQGGNTGRGRGNEEVMGGRE